MRVRATLVLAGVVAILAAAVYAYVASRLPRAAEDARSRRALSMFALWWYALSVNIALVGVTYLLGAFDLLTLEMQVVDAHLQRALLCVSMVGLMHYLTYLLSGRDLLVPIAVFYGAYYVLITWALIAQRPDGLFVGEWRTDLTYAGAEIPALRLVGLGAILLPPVAASLAYFRLFFRVEDPLRRWRIALVSGAIVLWWAIAVLAGQRAALSDTPLQVLNRLLSLVAAFGVLAAYAPPAWARRRWAARSSSFTA